MHIDKIIVHCSDSPQDRGDNAEAIHRWHVERGFAGIGYHYVIVEDGTVEKGRPEYWIGAHCKKKNSNSIGVCLIGRGGDATDDQLTALRRLIDSLKHRYPTAEVYGHREFDRSKTCPGFDVREWYYD